MRDLLTLTPIGVIRTPFTEKRQAPRQPAAAEHVVGRVELFSGHNFEHALEDLEGFSHLWLVFWFHLTNGWRPKVLPPRAARRHGVFATRSPHRPNPIGLSLVELERIDGLTLHVRGIDILDGSPLLDIKPHVPYADSGANVRTGWLGPLPSRGGESARDPEPGFTVSFLALAESQLAFLERRFAIDLRRPIAEALALGPQPHPYRRIRRTANGLRLAIKDWRADFHVDGRHVSVTRIVTGYRPAQLWNEEGAAHLEAHRAFAQAFTDEP